MLKKVGGWIANIFTGSGSGGGLDSILDKFFVDKTKKLEVEKEIRALLFEEMKLIYQDTENARKMQMEALNQNDTFSKRFIYYLSGAVILNTIIAGILSFTVNFPQENGDLVTMYYTFTFMTGGAQMMRFFFGSNINQNSNFKENA